MQEVRLLAEGGQFPGVRGNAGVGCEHRPATFTTQPPLGCENTPRVQLIDRLPFATYPPVQPSTQAPPEAIDPAQLPAVIGKATVGVVHGVGWHDPGGAENDPRLQVAARDPEGLYPLRHEGTHVCPDRVDAEQARYVVDAVSDGLAHGVGLHAPAGGASTPSVHGCAREPFAVYPGKHVGVHTEPDGVGDGHDDCA